MKRIGKKMDLAVKIVAKYPGCSKKFCSDKMTPSVYRSTVWGNGYDPINRAIRCGLISAEFSAGKYSLRVTESGEKYLQSHLNDAE